MSEITKLYENAGLSNMWVERYNDGYYEHERYYNSYKEMINNMMKANDWTLTEAQEVAKRECRKELPSFSAEKQLKLIKWLLYNPKVDYLNMFYKNEEDYLEISIDCNNGYSYENSFDDNFEIAIASALNTFWQSLTEEEKQQVKGILE